MNVLILGSGAREHSIAWKLFSQKECSRIFVWPGNDGMFSDFIIPFPFSPDPLSLLKNAKKLEIDLVVIGPENLLAQGYADLFREQGILTVGPNKEAAQLETSKVFAKLFFEKAQIPTSDFQIFDTADSLINFKRSDWPWVLKLDGLASGKGVAIAHSPADVNEFVSRVWQKRVFGVGPHKVLTEEFISGREMSYIGFCDGHTFIPLASATDHKALNNNNQGPNTGGMGAISPSPYLTSSLESIILSTIVMPFLGELKQQGLSFRGILFLGLMITSEGLPIVLECNTRFGDPETQCVLPRLKSSFLSLLLATARGSLNECSSLIWEQDSSVYIVAASEGYPDNPNSGDVVRGLEGFRAPPKKTYVFFGGLKKAGDQWLTNGGRVLGVGALAHSQELARKRAYEAMQQISWKNMHYRTDIGST